MTEETSARSAPPPLVMPPPPLPPLPGELPEISVPKTPPEEGGSWELRVGTYWLVRVGVLLFLVGLVLAANYAYQFYIDKLTAGVKLSLLYLLAGGMTGAGWWLERRENALQRQFARVLFGGGLASVYYLTYAAHHVAALRVVENPFLAGILLTGWALVMVGIADQRRSQTLGAMSLLLAYFAGGITPVAHFTLFSNGLLGAAALYFLIRRGWKSLPVIGLVACYGGFAYWRLIGMHEGVRLESYGMMMAYLGGYWVLFAMAAGWVCRQEKGAAAVGFATANNAVFFTYAALLLPGNGEHEFAKLCFILGGVWAVLGYGCGFLRVGALKRAYLLPALGLLITGTVAYGEGRSLSLILAMESLLLVVGYARARDWVYVVAGYAAALLAVLTGWWWMAPGHGAAGTVLLTGALLLAAGGRLRWAVDRERGYSGHAAVFSLMGLGVWMVGMLGYQGMDMPWRGLVLSALALLLLGGEWRKVLPEAAGLGLLLQVAGLAGVIAGRVDDGQQAVAHWQWGLLLLLQGWGVWWWNRQARAHPGGWRTGMEVAASLCVVVAAMGWAEARWTWLEWVWAGTLAAFVFLVAGARLRFWWVALCGQLFLLLALLSLEDVPEEGWRNALLALVPVAGLAGSALARLRLVLAGEEGEARLSRGTLWVVRVYPAVAALVLFFWAPTYVSRSDLAGVYLLLAVAALVPLRYFRRWDLRVAAVVYLLAGYLGYIFDFRNAETPVTFAGMAAVLAVPWFLKRRPPPWVRCCGMLLLAVAVLGMLFFAGRAAVGRWGEGGITESWGLLAALLLVAGFLSRDRWYRWSGLAVFGLAVGRVALVDLWGLAVPYRILSIFVLSLIAMGVGFLYIRFADKIKKWL